MTPTLDAEGVRVYCGDALAVLGELDAASVDVVCTSPPYFGLRDYGDPEQLGLEPSLGEYLTNLTAIFDACRRVLRDTGTLWIVIGDSYAAAGGHAGQGETSQRKGRSNVSEQNRGSTHVPDGFKSKDLMLVPARLAIALQDAGWYLRKDVIWHKPNCMPESVTDRPTSSHEHVLMFSKQPRYFYDQVAMLEPYHYDGRKVMTRTTGAQSHENYGLISHADGRERWPKRRSGNKERKENHQPSGGSNVEGSIPWEEGEGRNMRDVWSIPTEPTPLAHFATYPRALVERVIRVACPPAGTVLDPFFGSGTTGLVARRLGRECIGIELNAEYVRICGVRLAMPGAAALAPADESVQLQIGDVL